MKIKILPLKQISHVVTSSDSNVKALTTIFHSRQTYQRFHESIFHEDEAKPLQLELGAKVSSRVSLFRILSRGTAKERIFIPMQNILFRK